MKRLKDSLGFSVVEALLILVIAGILGFTGWFVYHAKKTVNKSYSAAAKSTAPTYQKKTSTKAGSSQKADSIYTLSSVGASFSYPSDWGTLFTYPNGVALKSSKFQSAGGFSRISSGSTLTVSYRSDPTDSDTNASLTSQAASAANGTPASSKFITVAGLNAIEFTHSAGENRNQHIDVIFMKGSEQYQIDQEFNLNAQNPFPNLVSDTVSSFKFDS